MLPGPDLAWVDGKQVPAHRGVVEESKGVVVVGHEAVEEGGGEGHADCDGAHDFRVEGGAFREEGGHGLFEAEEVVIGGLLGPLVGVVGLVLAADFEGFLDVWGGGAEGLDGGDVGEIGYFLAAGGRVAAVGFGGGPCEGELGFGGEGEELG